VADTFLTDTPDQTIAVAKEDWAVKPRALLRGHNIDASQALSLHPEDFFDRNGEIDGGAVLWWLGIAGGTLKG
jgi:hypothetical protein